MKKLLISIGAILLLGTGWYLGSPLFIDNVVDEQLPLDTSGLTEEDKAKIDAIEALTPEQLDAMTETERMEAKQTMEELGQKMPDKVTDEPMTSKPLIEASGAFNGADAFHRGSGKAMIYTLPDGKRVLRFEEFSVTNGPALSVYLVRDTNGNVDSGYLDLGKLKGNKGNQNYEIPADIDLSAYGSVVIWCVPFRVTFATATLR